MCIYLHNVPSLSRYAVCSGRKLKAESTAKDSGPGGVAVLEPDARTPLWAVLRTSEKQDFRRGRILYGHVCFALWGGTCCVHLPSPSLGSSAPRGPTCSSLNGNEQVKLKAHCAPENPG